ncbi:hypothetical protein [Kribbella sp. HUAS MG21]|uniref:Uncharacterized protein n=1 Tax=Kribbella sp. HUAS MG21 TaxID=3160966 RepID=A0AAU7TG09_9ACTN
MHHRSTPSEPIDGLVLELPADEPEDVRLDADAFIRVWPDLLERWGTDIEEDPEKSGATEDSQVGAWLSHLRTVRATLDISVAAPEPGDKE